MVNGIPLVLLSYLIGSIPTSVLAGKIYKRIDIRDYGSGNAGATNVFRVLGRGAGIIVLIVDVGKGFVAGFFVPRITFFSTLLSEWGISTAVAAGDQWTSFGAGPVIVDAHGFVPILCMCTAVVGHMFPVFARFRGGKGVGTGAGGIFGVHPLAASVCLATFLLTLVFSGFVSLSSIFAAAMLPVGSFVIMLLLGNGIDIIWMIFSLLIAALIIFMHRSNIKRLLSGEESRFEKIWIFKNRDKSDRDKEQS